MPAAGHRTKDRAVAHYNWAKRYDRNGDYKKAAAHFGRALEYGGASFGMHGAKTGPDSAYSFYFNEKAEPNASSLGRLMDRSKYADDDVYDFKLESESGIPLKLEMRRAHEAVDNVHNVWLDYQESAKTKITLAVVVAGARNTVDVRSALSLKAEVEDAAATAAIRLKGGVMLKRAAKYNEDATKEDDRRTTGLTMRVFGTLLSFLAHIGMCDAETSVYVYPGEIVTQSKPKVDESGAPKGLDSLVEYYRRSTIEPLRGRGIMVTTAGQLIERGAPISVCKEYDRRKKTISSRLRCTL
jgi:hypothetical protein